MPRRGGQRSVEKLLKSRNANQDIMNLESTGTNCKCEELTFTKLSVRSEETFLTCSSDTVSLTDNLSRWFSKRVVFKKSSRRLNNHRKEEPIFLETSPYEGMHIRMGRIPKVIHKHSETLSGCT